MSVSSWLNPEKENREVHAKTRASFSGYVVGVGVDRHAYMRQLSEAQIEISNGHAFSCEYIIKNGKKIFS